MSYATVTFITYRTDVGTPTCRPIEAHGTTMALNLAYMVPEPGQEFYAVEDGLLLPRGTPDEWMLTYFDPVSRTLINRPELPALPAQGTAPMVVDLAAFPDGTTVTLTNEAGEELTLTLPLTEPLTLEEPGQYRVDCVAPFPHLPKTQEITLA